MSESLSTDTHSCPLSLDEAEQLDKRIRRMADAAARNLDALAELVAKAKVGSICETLGFPSWPAYLADALKPVTKALGREELHSLTIELHNAGVSLRGIGDMTAQSKSTVARKVSQSGTADADGELARTTGLDGKTYTRRHNGGARGKQSSQEKLSRAKSAIENIPLAGDAADKQSEICRLIDELLDSIKSCDTDSDTLAGSNL